jgi:prevent-host-death family protein
MQRMAPEVGVREARTKLGELVRDAARGNVTTITVSGLPAAELRPVGRGSLSHQLLLASEQLSSRLTDRERAAIATAHRALARIEIEDRGDQGAPKRADAPGP